MRSSKPAKRNLKAAAVNPRGRVFPQKAVNKIREGLPKECAYAFNTLVNCKCSAQSVADYLTRLALAFTRHVSLNRDPTRIDWRTLRSLVNRTLHVAKAWEKQFSSAFGQEVLALAVKHNLPSSRPEFLNVPQRLRCLAESARKIHKGTLHLRRPEYDDILAELCVYVELVTGKAHNNEISLLVGFATERPDYNFDDLGVWKNDHKPALERARRRLTNT